jgi:hypothetical protein
MLVTFFFVYNTIKKTLSIQLKLFDSSIAINNVH